MNYPFADADWFAEVLPKTHLYRRVKAGLLTLGHLRTAEAVGIAFLTGQESSPTDWGLLVSISQFDWRKSRLKASKCSPLWALRRDKNAPRDLEELRACLDWWNKQNYFPARTLLKAEEKAHQEEVAQMAVNRASSIVERLAMSVTRIEGWQGISNCDSIWDIPMVTATHLLVAKAEIEGAYHIPYDLIRMAKNG